MRKAGLVARPPALEAAWLDRGWSPAVLAGTVLLGGLAAGEGHERRVTRREMARLTEGRAAA